MMIDQRLTLLMKVLALELIAYLVSHGSHGDVFLSRAWGREGVRVYVRSHRLAAKQILRTMRVLDTCCERIVRGRLRPSSAARAEG